MTWSITMTQETATPTGVDEDAAEVVPNPRDEMLAEIARNAQEVRDKDIKDNGGEVIDTADEPEPEKEPAAEEPPPDEVTPEAKPEPEPEMVSIKVDGQVKQVPKDKIYEAGLRAVQKESTADKRLEEATKLLKDIESRFAPPPQEKPSPSPEWDDSIIAYALEHGNEEQKTEAVRQLRGRQKEQATPEQIAAFAEARVLDKVDFQNSAQWFQDNYKEVVSDPYLLQLAAIQEDRMRASGDRRSRKELYKEIGDGLVKWRGGQVPTASLQEKREQKAAITNLPSASVRKAAPETPKPKTASDIIEDMRKQRGQS